MPAPNYRMIRANKSAGTGKAISAISYSRACLSKASLQLCTPQRVLCNILFAYAYYTRLSGGMQWIFQHLQGFMPVFRGVDVQ